jgi:hypothetical protein
MSEQAEKKRSWVKMTIRRLLSESNPAPGQNAAIQCAVAVHGVPHALGGSLSEFGDGLRMLSPGPVSGTLTEQFFCYEDVIVVAVQRTVTLSEARGLVSS